MRLLSQGHRSLALADRSADSVEQALRDLEQAEQSMQAWGHTLTRLSAVLPPQEWQPAPPEGLEDRLRLLDSAQRTAADRLVTIWGVGGAQPSHAGQPGWSPAGGWSAALPRAKVTGCRNTMQAFSIRQLKSNPSTVLRAAEQDAMALVTSHQQPTALVVALDRLGLPDPAAVRSGLALSLFRSGSISVASAARVADLPLPRFLEILAALKIPVVEGDTADLQDDLATARRWMHGGT